MVPTLYIFTLNENIAENISHFLQFKDSIQVWSLAVNCSAYFTIFLSEFVNLLPQWEPPSEYFRILIIDIQNYLKWLEIISLGLLYLHVVSIIAHHSDGCKDKYVIAIKPYLQIAKMKNILEDLKLFSQYWCKH